MLYCLGTGREILCSPVAINCERYGAFESTPGECCLDPDGGVAYDSATQEACYSCFGKEGGKEGGREGGREGRRRRRREDGML